MTNVTRHVPAAQDVAASGPSAASTVVLTGASAGIGAAAAVELAARGLRVVAVGRTPAKLAAVHRRMRAAAARPGDVPEPIVADFARLAEVRRVAEEVLRTHERVDVLVNNAGVQPVRRQVTGDGFELTFAVNHLAAFVLTALLVERLRASGGRVVTTASSNHAAGRIDFDDLQLERGWTSGRAYDGSKLANVLFTLELGRRTGLAATCFHPGSIRTDLNRDSRWFRVGRPLEWVVYGSPRKGARTLVRLATSGEGARPSALYYAGERPAKPADHALDADAAARLWECSERLAGVRVPPAA